VVAVEAVVEEPAPRPASRRWLAALGAASLVGVVGLAAASIGRPRPAQAVVASRPAPAEEAIAEEGQVEAALAPVPPPPAGTPAPAAEPPVPPPPGRAGAGPVGEAVVGGAAGAEPTGAPTARPSNEAEELVEPPRELPVAPIPEREGEPLDEWLPILRDWVHPVPGSTDIVPRRASRMFGAHRDGDRPHRCGGGHCGVDLDGERGQPVVAVAWGTVLRINRDADSLGGRYVRIEHPDFVHTTYFHLDLIAPDLQVGDEVTPGQALGTIGSTGIRVSVPHLHFSLEILEENTRIFIDPAPFLARAQVLGRHDVPEIVAPPEEPSADDGDI
jgi:murein DD-endopeptidase MepM/ murein hydrolase activator NlpD